MPAIQNKVVEATTTKTSSFFNNVRTYLREAIGKTQKEVQECRGKSLSEMAEMTSSKEQLQFRIDKLKSEIKTTEWLYKDVESNITKAKDEYRALKIEMGKFQEKLAKATRYKGEKYEVRSNGDFYDRFKGGETEEQFQSRLSGYEGRINHYKYLMETKEKEIAELNERHEHIGKRLFEEQVKLYDLEGKFSQ